MRTFVLQFGSVLFLLFAACGSSSIGPGGHLVGITCDTNLQCDSYCYQDKHYPGGMCTVRCSSDAQCPGHTSCVAESEDVCAVNCLVNADCAAFGRGFVCDARDRQGASGGTLVCRVP